MLEKIIKRTRIYGSALLLATAVSCGESDYDKKDSIINNVSYTSYSHENSINHWFVTGEDINVYVGLNDGVDSVYIDAERRFRDNTIREMYNMAKDIGNDYSGVIPAFDDGGVLRFNVVVNQGEKIERSPSKEEPVFISENDAHDVIRNWLNSKSTELCTILYSESGPPFQCNEISWKPDFNLMEIEGSLGCKDVTAIIEYVGENDYYDVSIDESNCLFNNGVAHRYIYNLFIPGYYWGYPDNEVTDKQDLENYIIEFYSGL